MGRVVVWQTHLVSQQLLRGEFVCMKREDSDK